MRSHPHTSTAPHPAPPESHPVRSARRTQTRARAGSGRRRARPIPTPAEPALVLHGSPEAIYRAEKARRASNVDAAVMVEAKRLYDEAVAESGKKRAGMRSAVIPPALRRGAQPDESTAVDADAKA